jgi:hypothetical protein
MVVWPLSHLQIIVKLCHFKGSCKSMLIKVWLTSIPNVLLLAWAIVRVIPLTLLMQFFISTAFRMAKFSSQLAQQRDYWRMMRDPLYQVQLLRNNDSFKLFTHSLKTITLWIYIQFKTCWTHLGWSVGIDLVPGSVLLLEVSGSILSGVNLGGLI